MSVTNKNGVSLWANLPATKNETPQKMRRFSHKGIFPTNLTNHGVRRPHLSGSPTPPTSTFIPPHPAEMTVHGP